MNNDDDFGEGFFTGGISSDERSASPEREEIINIQN